MSLLPLALLLLASPVEGLKKENGLLSSVVRLEGQLGFINENLKDDETMLSNKILPKKNTLSDGPVWPAEDELSTEPQNDEETVPFEFTWRDKGLLHPPQDQMSCGACWAFPFASQLEFLYKIYTGEFAKFSEQFLIECISPGYCGCWGGEFKDGARYVRDHHYLPREEDYAQFQAVCKERRCVEKGKNGFTKLWLIDFLPV